MGLPKERAFYDGGLTPILNDVTLLFSGSMLDAILEKHNAGYSLEQIAEYVGRDPDEVFLAIFHLGRQGYEIRKIEGVRL